MITLPIDIVGLAQASGMSQTVQGQVRIDTGSQARDDQIRAIFWKASEDAYAVLAGRSREARPADVVSDVVADAREQVAAWMIAQGFATGHGATVADLLRALETEIADLRARRATLSREGETR